MTTTIGKRVGRHPVGWGSNPDKDITTQYERTLDVDLQTAFSRLGYFEQLRIANKWKREQRGG